MALLLPGCGSPPAVLPLLEVTRRALHDEAENLSVAAERDAAYFDQARAALDEAYEADLANRETLDTRWVTEATTAYVAAREALQRSEAKAAAARERRAENLRAAAEAQGRAMGLLQQQDAWLTERLREVPGAERVEPVQRALDVWRWEPPINRNPNEGIE